MSKNKIIITVLTVFNLCFISCKRAEYYKPEDKGHGTIKYTLLNATEVNTFDGKSNDYQLYIKNIGYTTDSLYNYIQISADNNLEKLDFKKIECQLRVRKNYKVGDTIIFSRFFYYEGIDFTGLPTIIPLNGQNRVSLKGIELSGDNSQKWIQANSMQDLTCSVSSIKRLLKNLVIDANSFGTLDVQTLNNVMAFTYNNLSCGTFKAQTKKTKQLMHPYRQPIQGLLGVDTVEATFDKNDSSPFSKITIAFQHLGDALAYGPVGQHDFIDGRGTTNITVTGVHRNGSIYREQKDKGYVYVRDENVWRERPNTKELLSGNVLLEFDFDLVNNGGDVISITNGRASYLTYP